MSLPTRDRLIKASLVAAVSASTARARPSTMADWLLAGRCALGCIAA
ncbi:hypothetical protein [Bradyrhizobium manausense]|nr:hypothetical protein [Bradyrhizobium manausense]